MEKTCEIVCNQSRKEDYIERLNKGSSFYLQGSKERFTFSIESAVELRDYLTDMIEVAELNGYIYRKGMTVEEIEKALGYKIKIKEE